LHSAPFATSFHVLFGKLIQSAGTLEDWRDDSDNFGNAEMGKKYKGLADCHGDSRALVHASSFQYANVKANGVFCYLGCHGDSRASNGLAIQ
jgi:hypothetical protein